jgi:thiamine-phosphate pyrophosphorylase
MKVQGLYFITDSRLSRQGILQDAKDAVEGGCRVVQYREKEKPRGEMIAEATLLGQVCREKSVLFIVNNDVDVALAAGADGVHLGQQDTALAEARQKLGKGKIIGVTVHDVREALEAERLGADYVSVSPVFHTDTKPDAGKPAGVELVRQVKNAVKVPVVAIGGINESNLDQVLEAGADSIAVISAIAASSAAEAAARKITEAINDSARKR